MALRVSKTASRVLERVEIQIEPMTISVVEGYDPAAPLEVTVWVPDHGRLYTHIALEDLGTLADHLTEYMRRVQRARTISAH